MGQHKLNKNIPCYQRVPYQIVSHVHLWVLLYMSWFCQNSILHDPGYDSIHMYEYFYESQACSVNYCWPWYTLLQRCIRGFEHLEAAALFSALTHKPVLSKWTASRKPYWFCTTCKYSKSNFLSYNFFESFVWFNQVFKKLCTKLNYFCVYFQ